MRLALRADSGIKEMDMRFMSAAVLGVAITASVASAHIYTYGFGMRSQWVVSGSDSQAVGGGIMRYNHHTFKYDLDLTVRGIMLEDLLDVGPNGTPIHAYMAPRGEVGDMGVDFGYQASFFQEDDTLRLIISNGQLGGTQGNLETSIFEVENALFDGDLYIQLFTQQFPDGEIRGQFAPFGKNRFGGLGSDGFAASGPPSRIPAPASVPLFLAAGAFAAVRRRRS